MKKMNYIRSYSELMQIESYVDRFRYLKLDGRVGERTFGSNRLLNQILYSSEKWKRFRRDIIIRDKGCDLGIEGYEIDAYAEVHHINPITVEDAEAYMEAVGHNFYVFLNVKTQQVNVVYLREDGDYGIIETNI